jgi:hypothetical protein
LAAVVVPLLFDEFVDAGHRLCGATYSV